MSAAVTESRTGAQHGPDGSASLPRGSAEPSAPTSPRVAAGVGGADAPPPEPPSRTPARRTRLRPHRVPCRRRTPASRPTLHQRDGRTTPPQHRHPARPAPSTTPSTEHHAQHHDPAPRMAPITATEQRPSGSAAPQLGRNRGPAAVPRQQALACVEFGARDDQPAANSCSLFGAH